MRAEADGSEIKFVPNNGGKLYLVKFAPGGTEEAIVLLN